MDQFRKLMKIGEYLFGTHGLNFAPKIFLNVLQLKDTYSMLFMNMQIRFYHVMNANVYARCVCVCVWDYYCYYIAFYISSSAPMPFKFWISWVVELVWNLNNGLHGVKFWIMVSLTTHPMVEMMDARNLTMW